MKRCLYDYLMKTVQNPLYPPPSGLVSTDGSEAFNACKNGNLQLIKKLISTSNANVKDRTGRKSSLLHFAAGMCACRGPSYLVGSYLPKTVSGVSIANEGTSNNCDKK